MANTEDFDIDYVAKLARLELTEEEKNKFKDQLAKIIDHFKKLSLIDTEGVEPTAHANAIYDVLREDVPGTPFTQNQALGNAPQSSAGQVVMPRIVE
jgi:aspartyl-tRNA(Asn)/glutamyl-tRNA(Gln) amidotransferase subunit C